MRATRKFAAIGLTFLLAGTLFASAAPKRARKSKKVKPEPQQIVEPPPQPPAPPPTPEQMPAVASHVTYSQGLLTIVADNSTLSDVLTNVRRATGANVDVPPATNNDRVAVRLGPGQPADVLRQLLAGSHFDYIILGTPQNQTAVARVIITPRGNAGQIASAQPQPAQQQRQPVNDYAPPADVDADETPLPEPPSPEPSVQEQPAPPPPGSPVQQQGPKTPEQLLQELQRMQNDNNPQTPNRNPRPPQ